MKNHAIAMSFAFVMGGLVACAASDNGVPETGSSGASGSTSPIQDASSSGSSGASTGTASGASTGSATGSSGDGSGVTTGVTTGVSGTSGSAGSTGASGTTTDAGSSSGSGGGHDAGSSHVADAGNAGHDASMSGSSSGDSGSPGPVKKFAGNISARGSIPSNFATYWTQFSPENEGKWGSVQGSVPSNNFNWSTLDTEYAYCKQNNIIFKEHNFIWGAQQPSGNVQPSDVKNWMTAFCARYPEVKLIDVVNEPLHTAPSYANNLGGAGTSGWDWIVNALTWARAACPNAVLIVNDYNTVEIQGDHDRMVSLVNAVKKAGGPIDAVGAQAHGTASESTSTLQGYIDDFTTKTGLPVYITEFDLNIADDNQQSSVMQSHFTMFWNDANVAGVTLWGYLEGETWETNSGLMSTSGTMRPAMTWLVNFLKTH